MVAGGMLLGYEQGVEVPEAGFNISGPASVWLAVRTRATHLFVGISSKPISKKICRNSCRTLFTEDRLSVMTNVGVRFRLGW